MATDTAFIADEAIIEDSHSATELNINPEPEIEVS